jgi:tetratricopeptide (TPR) repeat protein
MGTDTKAALLELIRGLKAQRAAAETASTDNDATEPPSAEPGAATLFTMGNLYYQLGDYEKAGIYLRRAVKAFPNFRRAHRQLGTLYAQQGQYDLALRSLSRCVELGGADGALYGTIGLAHLAKQNYVSAASAFRSALLLQPNSMDWRTGLARALFGQRNFTEAAALLGELIEKYPERQEFWMLQANAYLGMKDNARAAENFEILDRMGKATADNLNTLGDIYINEQKPALAVRAYTRAVQLDPSRAATVGVRAADILASRSAYAEAQSLVEAVTKTAGDQMPPAEQRKLLKVQARIAMASGKGGEAAEALEKVVAGDPLDGDAIMLLAGHYQKSGQQEKAVFLYERAANIEAFEADAKVRLAQLYVTMNRMGDAIPLLKRAQELKPREAVAKYLEEIEKRFRSRK